MKSTKHHSCFEDKRFVLNDGIHMLAYFYQRVKKQILKDDHKQNEIVTDKKDSKRFSWKEEILIDHRK